jgi:hypothetical protein
MRATTEHFPSENRNIVEDGEICILEIFANLLIPTSAARADGQSAIGC